MDNNIILTISSISIAVCGVSLLGLHMFTIGREKGRTISCQDSYNEGFNKGRSEGIRKAIQANLTSKMYPDGNYPADIEIIDIATPSGPVEVIKIDIANPGAIVEKLPLGRYTER